jgi:hypothetical protein
MDALFLANNAKSEKDRGDTAKMSRLRIAEV